MNTSFDWKPEPVILEKVSSLANQRNQSPEEIVTEAVKLYLEMQEKDSLVGLFTGSPDLATRSEEILEQKITKKSGWTWKEE